VFIGHDLFGSTKSHWVGSVGRLLKMAAMSVFVSQRMGPFSKISKDRMAVMTELLESGKVTSVVDRTFALSEVPEAILYMEEGRALGKIIIRISPPSPATSRRPNRPILAYALARPGGPA